MYLKFRHGQYTTRKHAGMTQLCCSVWVATCKREDTDWTANELL